MMGHLQSLQAVVLLCSFSLCRPPSPRLASLLDVAVGIASDLRLYSENDASAELVDSGLGNFSREFKDFVHRCLRKEPRERPSARELLKHPWVKKAKRTAYLTELIERHERWQATHREEKDRDDDDDRDGYITLSL